MNWYLYHKNGRLAVVVINEHHQNNTQYMYFWLSLPSSQPMGNDSDISLCLSINSGVCPLTLISLHKFWYLSINYDICPLILISVYSDICPLILISLHQQDLSYKDRHWHEFCFKCCECQKSLVDQPFAPKNDNIYCSDCHDKNFAARCDGCGEPFRGGK